MFKHKITNRRLMLLKSLHHQMLHLLSVTFYQRYSPPDIKKIVVNFSCILHTARALVQTIM